MKLVELLAQELSEWPEGYDYIAQDCEGFEYQIAAYKANPVYNQGEWGLDGPIQYDDYIYPTECSDPATDHATAIVTREMWEAERALIAKQEKEEMTPAVFNPIEARDRIREIDTTVEALEEERAALIQQSDDEGFQLIASKVKPGEDMDDWWNWESGDLLEVVVKNDANLHVGGIYPVRSTEDEDYDGELPVSVYVGGHDCDWVWPKADDEYSKCVFKFHSRP